MNPPQDVSSYTLKENEVKMVSPKYDSKIGEFKWLYKTIGYLNVRDSPEEVFFNYGYDHEKSKVLLFTLQKENSKLFFQNYI